MPSSAQEKLINLLAQTSLGGPYVFEPDDYSKGTQGRREPADLAWMCRDVLILFAMQAGRKDFRRQSEHNFRQLLAFLRPWSEGYCHLKGKNEFQEFDLAQHDSPPLILVSVVECSDARVQVHREMIGPSPRNSGERSVVLCASIPTSVFLEIAARGGSALDLADLFLQIAEEPQGVGEELGRKLVSEAHESSIARARACEEILTDRDVELDRATGRTLVSGLRNIPFSAVHNVSALNLTGSVAVLNDLDWEMSARLILRTADVIRMVRDVPQGEYGPTCAAVMLDLDPYRFIVGAADVRSMVELSTQMQDRIQRLTDEKPNSPPISIQFHMDGRPKVTYMGAVLAFPKQTVPSVAAATFRSSGSGF